MRSKKDNSQTVITKSLLADIVLMGNYLIDWKGILKKEIMKEKHFIDYLSVY